MKNVKFPATCSARFFPALLAFLFFLPALVSAAPVSVTTRITPDTFTLGDIATYTISVQHDADIHPFAPEITPTKGLELVEKSESPSRKIKGQVIHEYGYQFRVDDIGVLTLPAIPVFFNAPDPKKSGKTIQGTIMAPKATLEVQSLLSLEGEEIHDIKPLEEISPPWLHYLWMALGVLALLALLYFLWRRWKTRPIPQARSATALELTPEQLAYKELEALRVKGWLQIGRVQEHFFELSEIFRRYLENRYQFPAREWTTQEITTHFKHFSKLNENLKQQAQSILTQTDHVKFARAELIEDEMPAIIRFIQEVQRLSQEAGSTEPVSQAAKQS